MRCKSPSGTTQQGRQPKAGHERPPAGWQKTVSPPSAGSRPPGLPRVGAADFTQERLLRLLTTAPGAFWRFDVDVSLAAAVKMARFAHLAGVSATFYLNPRSEYHNLFSAEGASAVVAIATAGHRLGLHCDYRAGSVSQAVAADRALLEADYYGLAYSDAVSFHIPPTCVLWRDFENFESAYASKWEGCYLSDARREFGPEKEAAVSDDMQVCLHPEHWFG